MPDGGMETVNEMAVDHIERKITLSLTPLQEDCIQVKFVMQKDVPTIYAGKEKECVSVPTGSKIEAFKV